ncbi:MAG: asparagine synthase (glutamine-hydrolyzing) [Planctomycetota bacterium]
MCGIAGIHLRSGAATEAQVRAMCDPIVHRGPDGEGVHVDGPVGIGMRRLSIIDLEGGWQPIANETGRIHIVLNGELYNFPELRRELEARGHVFRTHADTEVALNAYEDWGGWEFASRLRGMFGLAIWDADKQELWLARDRIGIKPLYYLEAPDGFAFGSEVKCLTASPVGNVAIEPRALCEYFTFGSAAGDGSFLRGVRQLRPGHVLRLQGDAIETRAYWSLSYDEEPITDDVEEAAELLEERLRESVRAHLLSDVPVGAFLSGGLDSSAIVALMAQEGARGFPTFSIGFDEQKFNELPYAREVADKWGTEHHEMIVRPDATEILDKLVFHLDEPFADASALPTWYVSELAAQHVKVVLSGDGGDELFAGYERYHWASRDQYLDRIPMAARRAGRAIGNLLPDRAPGRYFIDYAAEDRRGRYLYSVALLPRPMRNRILRPEFHPDALGIAEPLTDWREVMERSGAPDDMTERMHLDILRYLPMDILVKIDRMTMAHSLESRPPLLDHNMIEFAARVPLALKYAPDGTRKFLLRKVITKLVPPSLLTRPKSGFSVPLGAWFAGPLRPLFEDQVLDRGRSLDYLDAAAVRRMHDENLSGRRDHGIRLWAILVLETWMRQVLQPATAS